MGARLLRHPTHRADLHLTPMRWAVWTAEYAPAAIVVPCAVAALVHEMMVMPTQQHEIVEARIAAFRQVTDVVTIDKLVIHATREAAATIPRLQCPTNRGRKRS